MLKQLLKGNGGSNEEEKSFLLACGRFTCLIPTPTTERLQFTCLFPTPTTERVNTTLQRRKLLKYPTHRHAPNNLTTVCSPYDINLPGKDEEDPCRFGLDVADHRIPCASAIVDQYLGGQSTYLVL